MKYRMTCGADWSLSLHVCTIYIIFRYLSYSILDMTVSPEFYKLISILKKGGLRTLIEYQQSVASPAKPYLLDSQVAEALID